MLSRLRAFLKWLIGGLVEMASDKAALLVATGAMLIPVAMTWGLEAPANIGSFGRWGVTLFVAFIGLVFIAKGWSGIRQEEEHRIEAIKREKEQRQASELRRQKEHVEYITTLRAISKALGVKQGILGIKIRQKQEDATGQEREKIMRDGVDDDNL